MKLIYPVGQKWQVSQTFEEHIQRAKQYGWCTKPGNCPSGIYYFGGIDWACPTGTPIYAAAEGTVAKVVRTNAGYGWAVYILHPDGFTTIYGHMGANEIKVDVGDKLPQGAILGYSDNTGNSSGPHIHFELRDKAGMAVDPKPYLTSVTFPPIEPPTGKVVRAMQSVNCRTEPAVLAANTIGLLKAGKIIECTGEAVEAEGRKWSKCIVYIASEFLEPV